MKLWSETFSSLSHYGLNVAVIVCRTWKRVVYTFEDGERQMRKRGFDDWPPYYHDDYGSRRTKRARRKRAPVPLKYHLVADEKSVRIVDVTEYFTYFVKHRLNLADIDVNDVRFSGYNFSELRIACKSVMEGQLLGRLLQRFPSLRTVREIEVEYPYGNRDLSIMFRRLKALTHLRRLSIAPRDHTRGFILSSRMDEDALLGLCLRRGPYVPTDCKRELDVRYFVSRRFLLRLIEAFKTVVGRTTIDVLHRPHPTALEEWLGSRRKHFLYGGSDVVKSTLTIRDKKRAHVSVWYKCTESNISFLHYGCQFLLSNNAQDTKFRISDLVSRSLDADDI
ncbi:hypothetical protein AAVH_00857 [Aphelenchoides avenae]|nr:hypothetical protein AAVH_00857 [Aphelenchus avenae]